MEMEELPKRMMTKHRLTSEIIILLASLIAYSNTHYKNGHGRRTAIQRQETAGPGWPRASPALATLGTSWLALAGRDPPG